MKRRISILTAIVGFAFIATAFTLTNMSVIDGNWKGEFKGTSEAIQVQTHFWTENDELKGTIDFPAENIYRLELSWIMIDEANTIHFEVVKNSETLVFDGKLINNDLTGQFSTKTGRGIFTLSRVR